MIFHLQDWDDTAILDLPAIFRISAITWNTNTHNHTDPCKPCNPVKAAEKRPTKIILLILIIITRTWIRGLREREREREIVKVLLLISFDEEEEEEEEDCKLQQGAVALEENFGKLLINSGRLWINYGLSLDRDSGWLWIGSGLTLDWLWFDFGLTLVWLRKTLDQHWTLD